jgi:hypothetical protein
MTIRYMKKLIKKIFNLFLYFKLMKTIHNISKLKYLNAKRIKTITFYVNYI